MMPRARQEAWRESAGFARGYARRAREAAARHEAESWQHLDDYYAALHTPAARQSERDTESQLGRRADQMTGCRQQAQRWLDEAASLDEDADRPEAKAAAADAEPGLA